MAPVLLTCILAASLIMLSKPRFMFSLAATSWLSLRLPFLNSRTWTNRRWCLSDFLHVVFLNIYFEGALCWSSKQCLSSTNPRIWRATGLLLACLTTTTTSKPIDSRALCSASALGTLIWTSFKQHWIYFRQKHWDYTNPSIHQSILWALCPWLNGQQMNACANKYVFHYAPLAPPRYEYQREAAWYGIALFHLHPSWMERWEEDAIMKKLLGLTLDVDHTQSSW